MLNKVRYDYLKVIPSSHSVLSTKSTGSGNALVVTECRIKISTPALYPRKLVSKPLPLFLSCSE